MSDIKTTFTIFCYSFLFFRFCDFFFIIVIPCLFPNFCLYFPYICNVYFTLRIIIYLISLFSVYIYSVFISVLVYSLFSCVYFLLYFYSGVLSSPECSRHDILSDYRKSLLHHALGLCSWTIDSLSLCLISFFSSAFCLLYVLLTFHPLFWAINSVLFLFIFFSSSSSSSYFCFFFPFFSAFFFLCFNPCFFAFFVVFLFFCLFVEKKTVEILGLTLSFVLPFACLSVGISRDTNYLFLINYLHSQT